MQAIDEILMYLMKIEELKKTFGVTEEQIYCAKYKQRELKDEIRHEQGN